jgi:hypothetical protein
VQGWDESQSAREFYASFLGSGANYQAHAASKQSVLALVGAGFGMTLVTKSQAEVRFPGVVFIGRSPRKMRIGWRSSWFGRLRMKRPWWADLSPSCATKPAHGVLL